MDCEERILELIDGVGEYGDLYIQSLMAKQRMTFGTSDIFVLWRRVMWRHKRAQNKRMSLFIYYREAEHKVGAAIKIDRAVNLYFT